LFIGALKTDKLHTCVHSHLITHEKGRKESCGVSYPSWLWRRKSWLSKRLNAQRWTTARNAVDIDVRITIFRALCQGEKFKGIVSRDGLGIFGPGFSWIFFKNHEN
jgi:hypothetical protein